MADYFTQILQADNHRQLGNRQEAERHLLQASFMCPNRFVPLRELFRLFQSQADTAGMHRMADAILRKPVKVDSPEVRGIIAEMKRFKTVCRAACSCVVAMAQDTRMSAREVSNRNMGCL